MKNEEQLIRKCLGEIETVLGWGDSGKWGNLDFENLSERIFQKTKVKLSVSTLKRLWGKVRYASSPTHSTLNVLAQFLDCSDWREFQAKSERHPVTEAYVAPAVSQKKRAPGVWIPICAAFIAIAGVGLILAGKEFPTRSRDPFLFKAHVVSDGLPNSVVFDYRIPNGQGQHVFIQQSWDSTKRKEVSPTGRQHTSLYFRPGYFRAKLIVDGKTEREDTVFIQTNGWAAILETQPVPVYLTQGEVNLPDGLGSEASTLSQKLGEPVFNDTWVSFSNVKNFNVDGTDLIFEAQVKNTSTVGQSSCRRVKLALIGKNGWISIPLATTGCSAAIDLATGDQWIPGNEHDLSGFGCTYEGFESVRYEVAGKKIRIFHNSRLVHESEQQQSIGDIVGIRISFEGSGVIGAVRLSRSREAGYTESFARK